MPLGTPPLGASADKVAVKVMFEPVGDGLAEEATTLATDAGVMVNCPLVNETVIGRGEGPLRYADAIRAAGDNAARRGGGR